MTKTLQNSVKKDTSDPDSTIFPHFKNYADFLLQNHLDDVVKYIVEKSRDTDFNAYKLLVNFSDDELFEISKEGICENVLIPISENSSFGPIRKKLQSWKENTTGITREDVQITDITAVQNLRKRALINFIKFYNCADEDRYKLIDELEVFFETCVDLGLQTYEEIQKNKLTLERGDSVREMNNVVAQQMQTEEELTSLIHSVKDYSIFKVNPDGSIASWNEGAYALTGYTRGEILGKPISIFYPEEKRQERFPEYELKQAAKNGRFEDEGLRVRKDGSVFWANVVITAIYDQQNKLAGYTKITRDLTERRKAEEALKQSEEKARAMISGVKDYAIFLLNPDGTVASWNEGAERFKGYTEKEILGKHFSVFYPKEKRDSRFPEYELQQAERIGRFEDEGIRVRKDGTTFWANVVITAIYNSKKELLGFTKVTRDLTERKNMELALIQSEQRFRNLVEGVKDYAIYMLNPDGTIASWNEGARAVKGYNKEEIMGRHFSIFYPEDKKKEGFPELELEITKRTGRFEDEGFRVRKDGTKFWANVIITSIYNDDKQLIGFTKITRDLTERKQTEEFLRRSEERYRLLVDAVKDYAIFIIDLEGMVNSWNEGARRLKGYTESEVLGKHISIFYTKDKQEEKYADYELEQAKSFGRFEDEGLRVRKDGSTFYANVIITPLYDKDRKLIGFSKITRDLTERKRFEENLHKLNSELEKKVKQRTQELENTITELKKVNNDLDNFIYTASHDLKAPVSNIEGLITELFKELGSQPETNQNLKIFRQLINTSIQRFQMTISELTEIAKIQKNSMEDSEIVDLQEVIDDVKLAIRGLIIKQDAEIITDLNGLDKIKFVRKNLKSIFYNIISNGIKYSSPDRRPVVHIRCFEDGLFQVISFKDNGLGIKAESIEKIFTMFKRFHDHVEGTGVGLYIVKRIIENAGGKIEVESEVGKGTEFRIYIPKV